MDALVSQQRLTRLLYEISFLLVLALVLLPISGLTERRAFALASALAFACFALVLAWKAGRTDVPHPRLFALAALSAAFFAVAVASIPFFDTSAIGSDVVCLIAALVAVPSNAALLIKSWQNN